MRFAKRNISGFAIIVSLIVVFTVLFIVFTPQEPLAPYKEEVSGSETAHQSEDTSLAEYSDDEPAFSVKVPADWTKITQNGYPTWICKEYNSSLQIQTCPSSKELLNITGDSIKQEIEALGGEIVDFRWMDEWNYTVSYRMFQKSGTTAHIEVTAFNTKDVVRFVFVITEIHYDKVYPTVAAVLDSFVWDRFNVSQTHDGSKPVS